MERVGIVGIRFQNSQWMQSNEAPPPSHILSIIQCLHTYRIHIYIIYIICILYCFISDVCMLYDLCQYMHSIRHTVFYAYRVIHKSQSLRPLIFHRSWLRSLL